MIQKVATEVLPGDARLPDELVASSVFLLKRLGQAAKLKTIDAYEQAGVNPYHYAIIVLLDEGVRETQAAIADTLGYDRGTLVGLLDELESQGLIERRRDPEDRRRHLVVLTPEGKRKLARLRTVAGRAEDEFLASLDDQERAALHELLLRLAAVHEPRCAGTSSV
jgi:MarR family transcriptional regulator, lower aerobic nicotinate degradation pathway regulator